MLEPPAKRAAAPLALSTLSVANPATAVLGASPVVSDGVEKWRWMRPAMARESAPSGGAWSFPRGNGVYRAFRDRARDESRSLEDRTRSSRGIVRCATAP
jgi:hypothetical protein